MFKGVQSFARGISPSGNRHRCLKFYLTKRSDQGILAFGLINAEIVLFLI